MVSMSCCESGASLPSYPCGACLVFLITSEGSNTKADGIKFYRAPRWAPNVLAGRPWLALMESSASALSPLAALERDSMGTKGVVPVDRTPTMKSVRAFFM